MLTSLRSTFSLNFPSLHKPLQLFAFWNIWMVGWQWCAKCWFLTVQLVLSITIPGTNDGPFISHWGTTHLLLLGVDRFFFYFQLSWSKAGGTSNYFLLTGVVWRDCPPFSLVFPWLSLFHPYNHVSFKACLLNRWLNSIFTGEFGLQPPVQLAKCHTSLLWWSHLWSTCKKPETPGASCLEHFSLLNPPCQAA